MLESDTIRLHTISFVCSMWWIFSPNVFKQFIMDQHAFGGLTDAEAEYLFTRFTIKGA